MRDVPLGVLGLNVRTGEVCNWTIEGSHSFVVERRSLGLPASGYLMGTYENPSNAGDWLFDGLSRPVPS